MRRYLTDMLQAYAPSIYKLKMKNSFHVDSELRHSRMHSLRLARRRHMRILNALTAMPSRSAISLCRSLLTASVSLEYSRSSALFRGVIPSRHFSRQSCSGSDGSNSSTGGADSISGVTGTTFPRVLQYSL